ncbi:hypothetical protein KEJ34_00795 [Candidatus Bathyarchaeota archaeon]|nr:hypothetical protein [Candidatus Bathyarchaeota archaeon]
MQVPRHTAGSYAWIIHSYYRHPHNLGTIASAGERICDIKRMFNVKCIITRRDDTLPYRIMHKRLRGETLGNFISPEDLSVMLNEYYAARVWDENGVPRDETLEGHGLFCEKD